MMQMQTTDTVLMVRPVNFTFNEQTAANNSFQQAGFTGRAQEKALEEFDNYVRMLREAGIRVIVAEDTPDPHTPDSIFPNNWFSTHAPQENSDSSGTLVLYPMFAPNRREERYKNILTALGFDKTEIFGFSSRQEQEFAGKDRQDTCRGVSRMVSRRIDNGGKRGNSRNCMDGSRIIPYRLLDLTGFEREGKFLEGTGSMILDRENKIAYCCASPRTDKSVLDEFARLSGYDYFLFGARDEYGDPIYHTNVMMSVGTRYAIVCLDAIYSPDEREQLTGLLEKNGKEILEISFAQMNRFAGNMLELQDDQGNPVLAMSATAYRSLETGQLEQLQSYYKKIVAPPLEYIEKNGGGSARCMLAEIFGAPGPAGEK